MVLARESVREEVGLVARVRRLLEDLNGKDSRGNGSRLEPSTNGGKRADSTEIDGPGAQRDLRRLRDRFQRLKNEWPELEGVCESEHVASAWSRTTP